MSDQIGRVALLWRGDRGALDSPHPRNPRLEPVFEALAAQSVHAEPAVYCEERIDATRSQLLAMDGVLVWVDPISDGRNRIQLDAMLREIASQGVWVSTHPDVILKMGVKEVLYRTRLLGWGADTSLYSSVESLRAEFPGRLEPNYPRVLKRNRGNGGQGVWKVERVLSADSSDRVRVLEARRGSVPAVVSLDTFLLGCEEYIRQDGCVIEQAFQPRLAEGMIRCYVSAARVVGFGHQLIKVESEWIPRMMEVLQMRSEDLPLIWDADFLYGPRNQDGQDTYVLCEINVSSVLPLPDDAPVEIARSVVTRLS